MYVSDIPEGFTGVSLDDNPLDPNSARTSKEHRKRLAKFSRQNQPQVLLPNEDFSFGYRCSQNTIAGNLVSLKNQSFDRVFFGDKYIIIWLQLAKEKLNNLSVHSFFNLEKTGFANKG